MTRETSDEKFELVILTGMSGAGRSTAARHLEDLGFFVVDNLPLGLLSPMVELARGGEAKKLAVVADLRSRSFPELFSAALTDVPADVRCKVVFLEASEQALEQRFETSRRPHPLAEGGRTKDAVQLEKGLLAPLRAEADIIIDTSGLNVYQLRDRLADAFGAAAPPLHLSIVSFGFKNGALGDACLLLDCRFIPNPHWVPELRPGTGKDAVVRDYVFSQEGVGELLDSYTNVLRIAAEGYASQGRQNLVVGVGCTGGRHRSVAVTEELTRRLREQGYSASSVHRDLPRE